jgi:cell division protein FtsQ
VAIAGLALGVFYFAWFRDSSLVAVEHVKVEGVTSSGRGQIVAALTDAAKGMTTLHVKEDELAAAVERFPTVAGVSANAGFPHSLTVHVTEREPVLVAASGEKRVPVAADGTVLPGVDVGQRKLPELEVDSLPASGRLGGEDLAQAVVVGAAPAPLLPLIDKVAVSPDYGIVLTLRGVEVRFGSSDRAEAKRAAAAAILADPRLDAVAYVDVRVPRRPAAGGTGAGSAPVAATDPAAAATPGTTASPAGG